MPSQLRPIKWAYGITTVPSRQGRLFPQTLKSLATAGFDQPRIFVDGDTGSREWHLLELEKKVSGITFRYPAVQVAGNWLLSLGELLIREPLATRYAIFQDDILVMPGLREYLDRCRYPSHNGPILRPGYWNLWTFHQNQTLCPDDGKWEGWYLSNQRGRGALALVFDQEAAIKVLTNIGMVGRFRNIQKGWKNIDGGVVTSMAKEGYLEYVHSPSLVQHTGSGNTTVAKDGYKNLALPDAPNWQPNFDLSNLHYKAHQDCFRHVG